MHTDRCYCPDTVRALENGRDVGCLGFGAFFAGVCASTLKPTLIYAKAKKKVRTTKNAKINFFLEKLKPNDRHATAAVFSKERHQPLLAAAAVFSMQQHS
jgi:hypothetical protein